ncbi:class I adenylate-forming enzyme family protein [Alkalihalobacterium alkalinitrilicum]|uniref:class I adenylate-forming enzyme family protein n=1 Tax=Alkalihalobacterium alkalinitrilicum TaxID=427920 RepID=UPI000994BDF5|nr:long-chain fatty acid--CoA ligase [Alkalihalobacterium alkalinitrilicum]
MNLGLLLQRQAQKYASKLAIQFEGTSFTYAQFNARVNQFVHGLRSIGVVKGDRVAVLLHNCNQYIEAFWAAAKLGAIIVPVNWRLNPKEVQFILDNSSTKVLVYGNGFKETVEETSSLTSTVQHFIRVEGMEGLGEDYETFIAKYSSSEPVQDEIELDDIFMIMYTSGTTGLPKGVMLTHNNIFWTSLNQIEDYPLLPNDHSLIVAPLFHVGGLLMFSLPAIHNGSSMVILRKFDVEEILKTISEEKATMMFCAPTMFHMIAEKGHLVEKYNMDSIRFMLSGGAVLPMPVIDRMQELFPKAKFTEGYGLTEAASCTSMLSPEHKRGSVGKPFLYNEIRVIDGQGNDVPVGQVGEVAQAGPTVMKGYWNNPKATEETFVGRWLKTGDLGRFDEDGFLYIIDRKKDMIISGGENIYPKEIETILYQNKNISEATVIGVPDEKWGEAVMALIVLKPECRMTETEVINFCTNYLASYKKPRFVKFLDELPKNPSGKILKHVLKKKYSVS